MGTKPEFLVAKDEMLVALAIQIAYEPIFRKGQIGPFFVFLGTISDSNVGFLQWRGLAETLIVFWTKMNKRTRRYISRLLTDF